MKKNRSMMAGLCLLAVMCAGYGAVSFGVGQQEKRKQEAEEANTIYLTDFAEVTGVKATRQGQTISLIKEDGQWLDEGDTERPVKQSLAALLASVGQQITASRRLEGAGALVNYGLDEPEYRAVFTDASGEQAEILVGDQLEDGRYYAKLEGRAEVYTIDSGLVSAMDYTDLEFTQPEILPQVKSDEVQLVQVTGAAGDEDEEDEMAGEMIFSRKDGTLTDEMAASAAGYVRGDCAAWKPDKEELAEMGFDGRERRLSYVYEPDAEEDEENGHQSTVVLEIGGLNETGTDYYVRQPGSSMILLMSRSVLDEFLMGNAG